LPACLHPTVLCQCFEMFFNHTTLNRHLTIIKIRKDPLRSAGGEEEQTAYHFLGKCSAKMLDSTAVLDHTYWSSKSYVRLNLYLLHGLLEPLKGFSTVTSGNTGMRFGLSRYGLSHVIDTDGRASVLGNCLPPKVR